MKSPKQRIDGVGAMANNMAIALQVTPEFIAEWAPTTFVYPLTTSEVGRANKASFSVEAGNIVNSLGQPVEPHTKPLIDRLEAYDSALCWSGLNYLSSRRERAVLRYGSPEVSFRGPVEPERARLTAGLFESIRATQQIGNVTVEQLNPKYAKEAEKRAARLAKTIGVVVLAHPEKIFLATENPTVEQLDAISQLSHTLKRKDRKVAEVLIASAKTNEEPIDIDEWQEVLRYHHMKWLTQDERDEIKRSFDEMIYARQQRLRAEHEGI